MPVCPVGSHVKSTVTTNPIWVQASDLCGVFSWWNANFGSLCNQLFPKLVDLTVLCATEPPALPTIDLVALSLSGQLMSLPQSVVDWLYARWVQTQWSTFCECISVSGTGTCPPVPQFGAPITARSTSGNVFSATAPVSHGWTTIVATFDVGSPSVGGNFFIGWNLRNAVGASLNTGSTTQNNSVTPGTPLVINLTPSLIAGASANADHIDIYGHPTGVSPQSGSTNYTFTPLCSIAYTGTCSGVPVTPPPPAVPTEPTAPTMPPLPIGPTVCTNSDICSELYQILNLLNKVLNHLVVPPPVIDFSPVLTAIAEVEADVDVIHETDLPQLATAIAAVDTDVQLVQTEVDADYTIDLATNDLVQPIAIRTAIQPHYSAGPGVGALLGVGTFDVGAAGDLIGWQIRVTTRPLPDKELEGSPPYLWNMGWVSITNSEGLIAEKRISQDAFLWFPEGSNLASAFNWWLYPGVELSVVDLLMA